MRRPAGWAAKVLRPCFVIPLDGPGHIGANVKTATAPTAEALKDIHGEAGYELRLVGLEIPIPGLAPEFVLLYLSEFLVIFDANTLVFSGFL